MDSKKWIEILRRIPKREHEKLMVVTSIGVEISIQNIMRLEPEYVIFRGRLAGTTDMGRLFFVPYGEINYIVLLKEVTEVEFEPVFGPIEFPTGVKPALAAPQQTEVARDEETQEPPMTPPAGEPARPAERPAAKETLLERLRARARGGKTPNN
jgi:hypothetical protein